MTAAGSLCGCPTGGHHVEWRPRALGPSALFPLCGPKDSLFPACQHTELPAHGPKCFHFFCLLDLHFLYSLAPSRTFSRAVPSLPRRALTDQCRVLERLGHLWRLPCSTWPRPTSLSSGVPLTSYLFPLVLCAILAWLSCANL